jgi:pyruvate dehydrogenase E2 component (dihydrolipoamide acetyltransferase)
MAYEFKLPDIGEGVVEGEIVRWLVKEGDRVHADQPMVEIMTDKATVEIPAPRAGVILERLYGEGDVCPVGKVLVRIDEGAGAAPGATPAAKASVETKAVATAGAAAAPAPAARVRGAAVAVSAAAGPVLATPATRKLARELGVDLAQAAGTGPAGRITADDVRNLIADGGGARVTTAAAGESSPRRAALAAPGPDVRIPFRGLRRRIAERMVQSRREAAHYTYVEEVDCTELVGLRAKANARLAHENVKLSYLPFIIRATVEALRRFPQMNAWLDEPKAEIVQRRQYHIGLATATADGLIVPVVRDADRKSIVQLARDIDRLAALTKAGKAGRDDLSGSTFTVTSLGALGGVLATPILNYPEVGILGVHKISRRPAAEGDKIVLRDLMNLSISVDHRVVDGHDAARFVADIKESLETPGLLFLDAI